MSVRRLGQVVETLHAPVYFAPEPATAFADLGLRGYWRGYFASRSAALFLAEPGADASRVTELFGGFAPTMVARAIPEVWTITTPAAVYVARLEAAGAALSRLAPRALARTQKVLADLGERVGPHLGHAPLAAAEAARPDPDDKGESAWHWATVLREFRGDLHLAAVRDAGLGWPQMHVLVAESGRLDPQQRDFRGWTEQEWDAARAELLEAGLLGTPAGSALIESIEAETDERVSEALGKAPVLSLTGFLRPSAEQAAVEIPFPNAMGLVRLTD